MKYQRWSHPQDDLKTAARLSNPLYQKCASGSLAQKRDKSLNSMVVVGSWALTIATKGHVARLELKDLLSFRRRELGHAWYVSWSIFHRFFQDLGFRPCMTLFRWNSSTPMISPGFPRESCGTWGTPSRADRGAASWDKTWQETRLKR